MRTLQNGLTSGRIAHAYLFTGPRGTGKTSTARLLAKALCCEKGPTAEPCNECAACVSITDGSCMDVYEMDAASEAGVEEIREAIVEAVEYKPAFTRYRIFIIDEVHDLSPKAFDALLKTVEEPPDHVVIILATTEFNRVPPTIRSRCQKYEFRRATVQDLVKCLETVVAGEGVEVEPAALAAIARLSDGAYRDALTLLEHALLVAEGKVTLQQVYDQLGLIADDVADALLLDMRNGDIASLVERLEGVARSGRDPRSVLESLMYRLAELTRVAFGAAQNEGIEATREAALHETASRLGRDLLISVRSEISAAHRAIRDISLPRIWLESELIRISTALHAPRQEPTRKVAENRKAEEPPRPAPRAAKTEDAIPSEPMPTATTPDEEVAAPVDPALAGAQSLWAQVLEMLPSNTPISLKLSSSCVVAVEKDEITVGLEREMDFDWIMANPARHGHIAKQVKAVAKSDIRVKFVANKRKARSAEPKAVKLPAEGQQLHDLAREVLGS